MTNVQLSNQIHYTQEQISLIKSQIAKDATNDELKLFLNQCQRTGLDPLTRQIYFIKRAGRMTIQCSIDGFRVIAERSGMYAGQDEPVYSYEDNGELLKCAVTVYKFSPSGQRYPAATGVAFYKEYYPNPVMLQKTLKHTMLAKTAESLALRKAFPQDLSGLYTAEEMHQATPQAPTQEMKEELIASLIDLDMDDEKRKMAFESISKCDDIAQFQKIKIRLQQFPKIVNSVQEIKEDLFNQIADSVKPQPELTKQLNKLNKKMKANV